MKVYTLDAMDWPLIINADSVGREEGDVVATFPLPPGSTGDDAAGLEQLRLANLVTDFLNREAQ